MIKPLFDTFAQLPYQIDNAQHHFSAGNYTHLSVLTQTQLDDLTFCLKYLQKVGQRNQNSFNRFRNEIEKLLLWLWHKREINLPSLTQPILADYILFCETPCKTWCTNSQNARFKTRQGERVVNPKWRPFKSGALSYESRASMFTVLKHFCDALLAAAIITENPIKALRKKDVMLGNATKPVSSAAIVDDNILLSALDIGKNDIHKVRNLLLLYLIKKQNIPLQSLARQPNGFEPLLSHLTLHNNVLYVHQTGQLVPRQLCQVGSKIANCYVQLRGNPIVPNAPLFHKERGQGGYEVRQLRRFVKAIEKELS